MVQKFVMGQSTVNKTDIHNETEQTTVTGQQCNKIGTNIVTVLTFVTEQNISNGAKVRNGTKHSYTVTKIRIR